jgi:hypothetical protein
VLLIEALLHRVAGGDQQRLAAASVHQTPSRLVDDVDERNIDSACYRIGDQVHGDGADHDAIGTSPLKPLGNVTEIATSLIPAISLLPLCDGVEVH